MQKIKAQKPGPPPKPRFRFTSIPQGWRGAAGLIDRNLAQKAHVMAEFISLAAKRGITPYEYFSQYQFFEMPRQQQEEFITLIEAQQITWLLSREIRDVFWHKDLFNQAFAAFLRRDWLKPEPSSESAFRELLSRHSRLIVKPAASTEGRGIRILKTAEITDPDALLCILVDEDAIIEEVLVNDERLAAFNPDSLNTVRVVTLYNGSHYEIYGAVLRVGRKGAVVDNVSSGGLHATLDPRTGRAITPGIDASGNQYDRHPDSDAAFSGFQVPRWEEVLTLVRQAVDVLPNILIAGWDVALPRGRDAALVEGNHMPDFGLLQRRGGRGIKREFEGKVRGMFGARFLPGQKKRRMG